MVDLNNMATESYVESEYRAHAHTKWDASEFYSERGAAGAAAL